MEHLSDHPYAIITIGIIGFFSYFTFILVDMIAARRSRRRAYQQVHEEIFSGRTYNWDHADDV
jgi:hypothetical protein